MISVVLVNYFTADEVMRLTLDLVNYNEIDKIYIADNSSDIKVDINNDKVCILSFGNIGFGNAINRIAERIESKYILLLNPDVLLKSNFYNLIDLTRDFPANYFAIGCQVYRNDCCDPGIVGGNFPTLYNKFLREFGILKLLPGFLKQRFTWDILSKRSVEKFTEIDYVSGCCICFRASDFRELGKFNPRYFAYFEETELQKNAFYKLGKRNAIFNGASIVHKEGNIGYDKINYQIYRKSEYIYFNRFILLIFLLNLLGVFIRLRHRGFKLSITLLKLEVKIFSEALGGIKCM